MILFSNYFFFVLLVHGSQSQGKIPNALLLNETYSCTLLRFGILIQGQDVAFEPAKLLWLIQRDFLREFRNFLYKNMVFAALFLVSGRRYRIIMSSQHVMLHFSTILELGSGHNFFFHMSHYY